MNAFEALREQLEPPVPASGVLLISQKDGREMLAEHGRLYRIEFAFLLLSDAVRAALLQEAEEMIASRGPRPAM